MRISLQTGSIIALLVITASGAADLTPLRADLDALAKTLVWAGKGQIHATYSPVVPAAKKAAASLDLVIKQDPKSVPQGLKYAFALSRMVDESQYLSDLSAGPNYVQGALDADIFMFAQVDEWKYTITSIIDNLIKPSTFKPPPAGNTKAPGINKSTPVGTKFKEGAKGIDLIVVPPGTFTAGSDADEQNTWNVPANRRDFELPHRQVKITYPLAFGTTEVTVAQFDQFVQATGYQPRGGARWWNPNNTTDLVMFFRSDLSYLNPGFPSGPTHPAVAIQRLDAEAYAAYLSIITGARYRLPTEDEWEYAARAGSQDTFFWGHDIADCVSYANTYDLTAKAANKFPWDNTPVTDNFQHTAPVASFKPNKFGLYDVTANAREFTQDTWIRDLSTAKSDGSAHFGPHIFPVLRGGGWNYQQQNLRINYRSAYLSSEVATNMFGFRLVREL